MPSNLSVETLTQGFITHLQKVNRKDGRLRHIADMGHGFEGWLKFELAAMLCRAPYHYKPWIQKENGWIPGDVGVEHRARLKGPRLGADSKLVDVWVSPNASAKKWHFIELKVAFNNHNRYKMAASWRADFDALQKLHSAEKPASIASFLFGVDFTLDQYTKLLEEFSDELPADALRRTATILKSSKARPTPLLLGILTKGH